MTPQDDSRVSTEFSAFGGHELSGLIEAARQGSPGALGRLLEDSRKYLLLVANAELDGDLHAKAGASDLVQETFLEAQRDFRRFDGTNERELLAWLRRILLNNLANFRRRYQQTDKRQVGRERSFTADSTADQLDELLKADTTSPSGKAIRREEVDRLQQALERLTDDHRRVLILRHRERLSFREIGRQLGRSVDAARMLWWRAFERLASELERPHDHR